jgi:CheY-like chemotaxis protein
LSVKRVIVIDDCKLTLKIARDILHDAGYDVIAAETGMAANQYLYRKPRPDLILIDVEMPLLPGNKIVELLKQESSLQGIPIILMSEKTEFEMKKLCADSGADGYIVKPLRKQSLLQIIANISA